MDQLLTILSNVIIMSLNLSFYFIIINVKHTMNPQLPILKLFTHANEISKRFVIHLIEQAQRGLEQCAFNNMSQWQILSDRLNSPTKINCLSDQNHRALIIEFIRQGTSQYYKCSYFNNAKIDVGYLTYIKSIGSIEFIETIKIVNKLKLVEKHFRLKMEEKIFTENHIEEYIRKIMEKCNSLKRNVNNNFEKFKAIVEFQDRVELIKELGKLLRKSWSSQKQKCKQKVINPIKETNVLNCLPAQQQISNYLSF